MQKNLSMNLTNNENILINITPQETRVAFIDQGGVQELHIERTFSRGLTGNIYLGRVMRVLPGMQSAFIDIGLERAGFLHIADIWNANAHSGTADLSQASSIVNNSLATPAVPLISEQLKEGQLIMVQVIKDPINRKGARLSTHISIAGRMIVYLPQNSHIGISQRIDKETHREVLREKIQTVIQTHLPKETGGFIIRTVAEEASDCELEMDINYLRKMWEAILVRAKNQSLPLLLHQDLTLAQRVLRDFAGESTRSIQVDAHDYFLKLQSFATIYTPAILTRLVYYQGERPLFDWYGIEEEIHRALIPRVPLKSGGYLMIEQTEAMTTIDVNTGSFVRGQNFDDTIFKTNLEATHVIAQQLRLRNLGGIIILDFIDMENEEHKAIVLEELQKALLRDRTKTTVSGFSSLGLVEMTRKRTRESLSHILCEPCLTCGGCGAVKTVRTICYEILRDILREAKQFSARGFRILASQGIIDLFLEEESQNLALLEEKIGKPVSLQGEPSFSQEQYDIVLM